MHRTRDRSAVAPVRPANHHKLTWLTHRLWQVAAQIHEPSLLVRNIAYIAIDTPRGKGLNDTCWMRRLSEQILGIVRIQIIRESGLPIVLDQQISLTKNGHTRQHEPTVSQEFTTNTIIDNNEYLMGQQI